MPVRIRRFQKYPAHIGYSSDYFSEQFHRFAGMTVRKYMLKRRLTMAAVEFRDTGVPIIDISLKYGFSDFRKMEKLYVKEMAAVSGGNILIA